MTRSADYDLDYDRVNDTVFFLKRGINSANLINIDSEKFPGIIKRIDPKTRQCVGFTIDCFSRLFPANACASEMTLKELLVMSIAMTNDCSLSALAA